MPRSLEDRRRAVVEALRALSGERRGQAGVPVTSPEPVRQAALVDRVEPVVDAVVDAVEARLDTLSAKVSEVLARLDSVETTLLEAAWEHPPATPDLVDEPDPAPEPDERVSVPKVPFGEGRMSTVAAAALFGG